MENEQKKRDYVLPATILIAAVLVAGALIYSTGLKNTNPGKQGGNNQQTNEQNPTAPKIDSNDSVLGDSNAPVTVIEFGDFQCPYCAKFYKEIQIPLETKYIETGKVKMVYKPLAFLASPINESQNAVAAAECAKDQGKFWEFHDAIFNQEYSEVQKVIAGQMQTNEGNGDLNKNFFVQTATNLKLNVNDFTSCYDSGKHQNDYQTYMNEAQALMPQGISTPTVFINGQPAQLSLNSQREFDFTAFSALIDAAISAKK